MTRFLLVLVALLLVPVVALAQDAMPPAAPIDKTVALVLGVVTIVLKTLMSVLDHYSLLDRVPPPLRVVVTGGIASALAVIASLFAGEPLSVAGLIGLSAFAANQGLHALAKGLNQMADWKRDREVRKAPKDAK